MEVEQRGVSQAVGFDEMALVIVSSETVSARPSSLD